MGESCNLVLELDDPLIGGRKLVAEEEDLTALALPLELELIAGFDHCSLGVAPHLRVRVIEGQADHRSEVILSRYLFPLVLNDFEIPSLAEGVGESANPAAPFFRWETLLQQLLPPAEHHLPDFSLTSRRRLLEGGVEEAVGTIDEALSEELQAIFRKATEQSPPGQLADLAGHLGVLADLEIVIGCETVEKLAEIPIVAQKLPSGTIVALLAPTQNLAGEDEVREAGQQSGDQLQHRVPDGGTPTSSAMAENEFADLSASQPKEGKPAQQLETADQDVLPLGSVVASAK